MLLLHSTWPTVRAIASTYVLPLAIREQVTLRNRHRGWSKHSDDNRTKRQNRTAR